MEDGDLANINLKNKSTGSLRTFNTSSFFKHSPGSGHFTSLKRKWMQRKINYLELTRLTWVGIRSHLALWWTGEVTTKGHGQWGPSQNEDREKHGGETSTCLIPHVEERSEKHLLAVRECFCSSVASSWGRHSNKLVFACIHIILYFFAAFINSHISF